MASGHEPGSDDVTQLDARLALSRELHGLVVHELGNPLQSLAVLVELTRDALRDADGDGDGDGNGNSAYVDRLDRALGSVDRLRGVLHNARIARATLAGRGDEPATWGTILDKLENLMAERMTRLRIEVVRTTEAIDDEPIAAGPMREAVLAGLFEACEAVRQERPRVGQIVLKGGREGGVAHLGFDLRADGEAVEFRPEARPRLEALLASAGRVELVGVELRVSAS